MSTRTTYKTHVSNLITKLKILIRKPEEKRIMLKVTVKLQ